MNNKFIYCVNEIYEFYPKISFCNLDSLNFDKDDEGENGLVH